VAVLAVDASLPAPCSAPSPALPSAIGDTLDTDTLREVIVQADSSIRLPFTRGTQEAAKQKDYSVGGLLQKYLPEVNDYITNPFGFKLRQQKKKRKKVKKILEEYDAIDADPLQLFLDSLKRVQEGK